MNECGEPLISVVLPAVHGWPMLEECLTALHRQNGEAAVEIIVLNRCGAHVDASVRKRFPGVRIVPVDESCSTARIRSMGAKQARGRIIAFLEDDCVPDPHWLQTIAEAHAAGRHAVGGAVENGCTKRALDWATYFCEYTRFMPPIQRGRAAHLSGNNSAYDRRLFEQARLPLEEELLEPFRQQRLREAGAELHFEPAMVVSHRDSFTYRRFLAQRFEYSRSYAVRRAQAWSVWKRWLYAAACIGLPVLLLGRLALMTLRKRRHGRHFIRALPILCTLLICWAVGEAVGALRPVRRRKRREFTASANSSGATRLVRHV